MLDGVIIVTLMFITKLKLLNTFKEIYTIFVTILFDLRHMCNYSDACYGEMNKISQSNQFGKYLPNICNNERLPKMHKTIKNGK